MMWTVDSVLSTDVDDDDDDDVTYKLLYRNCCMNHN